MEVIFKHFIAFVAPLFGRTPWARYRRGVCFKGVLLGFIVLGAKWMLIHHFGGEVPYMDQWDAEADRLYAPILRGDFELNTVLAAHNEHRLAATQLFNLSLFELNERQWDPKLQMTAMAGLHAAWFGLLGAWVARRLRPRWHPALFGTLTACGVVPFGFENTLWGFQSQFYFLLLFILLVGIGLFFARAGTLRWCVGVAAAALGVVSFGSMGLVGVGLVGVVSLRWLTQRSWRDGRLLAAAGFGIMLVAAAVAIRTTVPGHDVFAADSWDTFSLALFRLSAWPAVTQLWTGVLIWAPLGCLVVRVISRRSATSRIGELGAFLGFTIAAQIMALAVFRGGALSFGVPASRYHDLLVVGALANFLILLGDAAKASATRRSRQSVFLLIWLVVSGLGLFHLDRFVLRDSLPKWREAANDQWMSQRWFLQTGNIATLVGQTPQAIGYPSPERLARLLRLPELQTALPPALQSGVEGFAFPPESGFRQNGFAAAQVAPLPYPVWGDNGSLQRAKSTSAPFELRRKGVEMMYAISADSGWVKIEFLSHTGKILHALHLHGAGPPAWRTVLFALPPGETAIRISDRRRSGWLAITAPREIAAGGLLAREGLAQGSVILSVAGAVLAFALWWPIPANGRKRGAPLEDAAS